MMDKIVETVTHLEAKTASLSNSSAKIVVLAAAGMERAVISTAEGNAGTFSR